MPRIDVRMSPSEMETFIAANHVMHIATLRDDGSPHTSTVWYCVDAGRLAFWTMRKSQKAKNIARDGRVSCLIETGTHPSEVRGVEVAGIAVQVDDDALVAELGRRIAERGSGERPSDAALDVMGLSKRVAFVIESVRMASWDHRKMAGSGYLSEWTGGSPGVAS